MYNAGFRVTHALRAFVRAIERLKLGPKPKYQLARPGGIRNSGRNRVNLRLRCSSVLEIGKGAFISEFVSGEAPEDKRTEWEVLGTRNRAALNQNFARELPLEYRAVLKDYYERLSR